MAAVKLLLLAVVVEVLDKLPTETAVPNCSFSVNTLLAEPKVVLAPALDGATLNGNDVKFVLERLRSGGGGGLILGGRGGATVGRLMGADGAVRITVELIESFD